MVPRPGSMDSFAPFGFNTEAVWERKVMLQFNFSYEIQGVCHFSIEKKHIISRHGAAEQPDITIDTHFGLWMDIIIRKADGQQAFTEQKDTVTGDMDLMLQLFQSKEA